MQFTLLLDYDQNTSFNQNVFFSSNILPEAKLFPALSFWWHDATLHTGKMSDDFHIFFVK